MLPLLSFSLDTPPPHLPSTQLKQRAPLPQIPREVLKGGHVVYEQKICRLDETVARQHGALAFTVMPVIDDDMAPSQLYSSSLGITSSPPMNTVLRHLRHLTRSGGDSLDRWNTFQFPIRETFAALFAYLEDNWASVSPNVQQALATSPLVPIGHLLCAPNRLFFRLSEDLSPFMHEIPRHLGAHEGFLKSVGVKEAPSSLDYCNFLSDFAQEAKGSRLNPNELNAAVAIVRAIAREEAERGPTATATETAVAAGTQQVQRDGLSRAAGSGSGQRKELNNLHVPSENCVLMPLHSCLVNDDEWLRSRVGSEHQSLQVSFVHSSISHTVARQLAVPLLSEVLTEKLVQEPEELLKLSPSAQTETLRACLTDEALLSVLISVVNSLRDQHQGSSAELEDKKGLEDARARELLTGLELVFVQSLATHLVPAPMAFHGFSPFPNCCQGEAVCFYTCVQGVHRLYVNCSMLQPPVTSQVSTVPVPTRSFIHPFIHPNHPSTHLSICSSINPSVHPSVYPPLRRLSGGAWVGYLQALRLTARPRTRLRLCTELACSRTG
jgi:hypothetical protein